jgi:excisionase family DNA binding protein
MFDIDESGQSEAAEPEPRRSSPCDWLTIRESSKTSKYSEITLRRALRRGSLRGYRPSGGRVWRIKREDLEAWMRGAAS